MLRNKLQVRNKPRRPKPDFEAFCVSSQGRLKKNAYLSGSLVELASRVLRNTKQPLALQVATGHLQVEEFDVFLVEKHSDWRAT